MLSQRIKMNFVNQYHKMGKKFMSALDATLKNSYSQLFRTEFRLFLFNPNYNLSQVQAIFKVIADV